MKREGVLLVLSGPSGVGKSTVLQKVFTRIDNLGYSVSATTRKPRNGEIDGKSYFFKTDEEFDAMVAGGEMLEYVEKFGNKYGTIKSYVSGMLESGKDVILEIETIGAEKVKKLQPNAIFIFITPPSLKELAVRLKGRNTETSDSQENRLRIGREEILCSYNYDYIVLNDNLDEAIENIIAIIKAERCKITKNKNLIEKIIKN